jgi:hypothetical protein
MHRIVYQSVVILMIPIAQHDWTEINIVVCVQNWSMNNHWSNCSAGILSAVMGYHLLDVACKRFNTVTYSDTSWSHRDLRGICT